MSSCVGRSYEDRLETISNVREAGISVCCGGILGLGEVREGHEIQGIMGGVVNAQDHACLGAESVEEEPQARGLLLCMNALPTLVTMIGLSCVTPDRAVHHVR